MGSRTHLLGIVLLMGLLLATVTACDDFWKTPTPTPTPPADISAAVLAARDAALVFLRQKYPDRAPAAGINWVGQNTTPLATSGVSSYEFRSGNCLMTVWVPMISLKSTLYEVALDNQDTGFLWTGKLSESYTVLESNLNVAVEVLVVHELVLAYFRANYAADAPGEDMVWFGERTTPEGSVGHEWCEFIADGWSMVIDYDLGRPDQVLYHIELGNSNTGLRWRCQFNAQGEILEIQTLSGT